MYASFFGLRESPFNLTPDPRYLFLSRYHKEALDILLEAIRKRQGLVTVTGDIGTGKTTLCRALLNELDSSTKSALIFNSFISDLEILVTISHEFAVEAISNAETKKDYFAALNRFLLETFRRGGNAVLLIDEAQNLSSSVFQQIQMLSDLQEEGEKLIQIILVGQTGLSGVLASPSLKPLSERIKTTYRLKSLEPNDVGRYIEHRLGVAGGRGSVRFAEGVSGKIYSYSEGNPRRINAVCDRALLIAYVKEKHTITKEIVGIAIQELHGEVRPKALVVPALPSKRMASAYAFLLFLVLMVVGFAGWTLSGKIVGNFLGGKKSDAPRTIKPAPFHSQPRTPIHQAKADRLSHHEQIHRAQGEEGQPESFVLSVSKPVLQDLPKDKLSPPKVLVNRKSDPAKRATFSVQVGAFLSKDNAQRLAADLKQKGYEPYICTFHGYRGRAWHTVRIVDCAGVKEAERAVTEYRQKEGKPALITTLDSLTPVSIESDEFDCS
jgi:type II secretory pathway predicted ATPase ExeA/cell division septation protein DedD